MKSKATQAYRDQSASITLPSVNVVDKHGVRTLHLGSDAIQGAMRLAVPDQIELEYVQQMMLWLLFQDQPQHVVQFGLGAAALTKFCYHRFPDTRVTAVELNPAVIQACRTHFFLPEDDARLQVLELNALDFAADPRRAGSVDILQIDLYDAAAEAPALGSIPFYQSCAQLLNEQGILTVNIFGTPKNFRRNCDDHIAMLSECFDAVCWLPLVHDANTVVLAFRSAPVIDFDALYERAAEIRTRYKLPAAKWVKGLQRWMQEIA
ncbi:spermidine synthase [Undibacterium luofuense]|uniref:spermine/spermidine synthase domain-containing protein n=1 Tax=Undibacterium luofuense TaxID=2828733 RepID=UPI0030ED46EB